MDPTLQVQMCSWSKILGIESACKISNAGECHEGIHWKLGDVDLSYWPVALLSAETKQLTY